MMWGYPNMGWGMWMGMSVGTLIFVALVVLLVWAAIRIGRTEQPRQQEKPSALHVLDERLARGEIDPDDYSQRRRILTEQH